MEEKDGFFVDDTNTKITHKIKIDDIPFDEKIKCAFCGSPFIDQELYKVFSMSCCTQCRYKNIKFVTKTSAIKDFLLSEYDLKTAKFISRPNPHKGNWHDMILYLEKEIKIISIKKYGSEEEIENIKNKRKETIKQRKIKKIKTRIRDLKRRTIVTPINREIHIHDFKGTGDTKKCTKCGLEIEQENI